MASLRLELFVGDIETSIAFYRDALGMQKVRGEPGQYTVMRLGNIYIDLQPRADVPLNHPILPRDGERSGLGTEIAFDVDDVEAAFARAQSSGWAIHDPLASRPWGLTDFRMLDPDGRYICITSRRPDLP